jgi:hypothetical protein
MSLVFSVLLPSGHTVSVSVGPNDPVAKILELACAKRNLQPESHVIRHGKNVLDLTSPVRFANLPNRCKLEVDEKEDAGASGHAQPQKVHLCLQLETGDRMQGEFASSASLRDVIGHFVKERGPDAVGHPADGEQPVVLYMQKKIVGDEQLAVTSLKDLGLLQGRALCKLVYRNPDSLADMSFSGELKVAKKEEEKAPASPTRPRKQPQERNIFDKMRELKEQNANEHAFDAKTNESQKEDSSSEIMRDTTKMQDIPSESRSDNNKLAETEADYSEDMQVEEEEDEPEEEVLHYIGDRGAVVFQIGEGTKKRRRQLAELANADEHLFDLSVEEVARLYKERVQEVKSLEDGGELLTKEFKESRKEAEKLKALNEYKKCLVQVQFPDGFILQAVFLSGETIEDLMRFLRQFLVDGDGLAFELFRAPPKVVLKEKESLLDAGCVPMAKVYFASPVSKEHYLKSDVMEKKSNAAGVEKAANNSGIQRKRDNDDKKSSLAKGSSNVPKWFKPGK